jgi:hypothetical protein
MSKDYVKLVTDRQAKYFARIFAMQVCVMHVGVGYVHVRHVAAGSVAAELSGLRHFAAFKLL